MGFLILNFRFLIERQGCAIAPPQSKIKNLKSKRPSAFTLLELMVVVIVIGILATMMLPNLAGQRSSAELKASVRTLHAMARHGHDRAVLRNRDCRLLIAQDADRASFRLEAENPDLPGSWMPMPDSLVPTQTLPASVRLASVVIDPVRRDPIVEQAIYFYADGGADAAAVQLTNGVSTWSVIVEPNTGRVDLADFAVTDTPNRREDLDA